MEEKEEELWDLSFDAKMSLAGERRERGNALYRGLAFAAVACGRERVRRWRKGAIATRPRRVP